jgi:hypothetical protein
MKRIKGNLLLLLMLTGIFVNTGCKTKNTKFKSPQGYDLNKPIKFLMPENLLEISGLALNNLDSSTIYSIQDEDGRVFSQLLGQKKALSTRFSGKGDYEDLAIMSDTVYVLKSNGTLYTFPLDELKKKNAEHVTEWKKFLPEGEYESLYADTIAKTLYVLSKNSGQAEKKYQVTGYLIRSATAELGKPEEFTIDLKALKAMGFPIKHGLRASALSRNPVTKEWYILSSINKLLVVTDSNWAVKSVYRLNSSIFNQPEGITFDKEQNLYISNEGDEITNGKILKFNYQPDLK